MSCIVHLKEVHSFMFELYVYTHGSRAYANAIVA